MADIKSNEVFTVGPVSGTKDGAPAPLPDAVVFTPTGPIELVVLDLVTVDVKALGAGDYSVVVSCGSLAPVTVSGTITVPVVLADTLVVPVSDPRPQ